MNWFYILLSVKQRKRYGMFLLVFQPNQSEFAVELGTLVRHTIWKNNKFTVINIYRIIWLTGKVLYELLLGIKDWKSWLLFEQTDRYKLLKIILRCPKISRRRPDFWTCHFLPFKFVHKRNFPCNMGAFLIGFCVFSVLIFIADFGFSHLGTFRLFYLTEKHVFFGQFLVFQSIIPNKSSYSTLPVNQIIL